MTLTSFSFLCSLQTLLGLLIDHMIGDPRWFPHPAKGAGRLISALERMLRPRLRNLRAAGAILCIATTTISGAAAAAFMYAMALLDAWLLPLSNLQFTSGWRSIPFFSIAGGGILCGIWFSWRSLGNEAAKVWHCLRKNDLPAARKAVSMIVGRDTEPLDVSGIARATIETVAENSVDGGLAPVFFALLGGPVLLTFYKAASTLDSMVGYRNEKYRDFGMVSARLDDVLNFVPARIALIIVPSASLLCALNPLKSLLIGWRDHARHSSPNSGWAESLFAGALRVQLGGPASYSGVPSPKPLLGEPERQITPERIPEAIRLLQSMNVISAMLTAIAAFIWHHLL